jgi:hypothetical protein
MCRVLLLVVVLAFAARQVTPFNDVGAPQEVCKSYNKLTDQSLSINYFF